jgi:hypothetical protein
VTPLGQARAQRAWRGLPLAPLHSDHDLFYIMMWEQERMMALRDARMLTTLLGPLGAAPEDIKTAFRDLYLAQAGRYSAPEERLRDFADRERRLVTELRDLREQLALASTGAKGPATKRPDLKLITPIPTRPT